MHLFFALQYSIETGIDFLVPILLFQCGVQFTSDL